MANEIIMSLPAQISRHIPISIGDDLNSLHSFLGDKKFSRLIMLTDETVKINYGHELQQQLKNAGHEILLFSFKPGEKSKSYKTKQMIENKMQEHHCDRNSLILALGGGVVGDLAGFVAATYFRGIPYLQIPTTLLAMVDSSVGGKTGINTIHGKNSIGMIHQPIAVLADMSMLKSLSKKHLINGLIEASKMFMTHDAQSFNYLLSSLDVALNRQPEIMKEIVTRAVKIKSAVVMRDEKESGERGLLNFGHTIGHALEKLSNYKLLHGHAVGYGILVEAKISQLLGLLKSDEYLLIKKFLSHLNINKKSIRKFKPEEIIEATKADKKSRSGKVNYVLLESIGHAYITNQFVHTIEDELVMQALINED